MPNMVEGTGMNTKDLPKSKKAQRTDLLYLESLTEGSQAVEFGQLADAVAENMGESPEYQALNKKADDAVKAAQEATKTATDEVAKLAKYDTRLQTVEQTQTTQGQTLAGKMDKATDPKDLKAGYLYQQTDGSVVLTEANPKFKYTIIFSNGNDGNPSDVQYADDCASFTAAKAANLGSWGDTDLLKEYFKPCVIQAGADTPAYYLNPTNLRQKLDGTASVLTGADGDVMVQVKKLYGKFEKLPGGKVKASISNVREDNTWFCWTENAGIEEEYAYRGRYMAGFMDGDETQMRSISGVAKAVNKTREAFRSLATARGPQYHQNNVYMLFLWEFMYLLMYKERNSQLALGQGRSLGSNTNNVACGWSDGYGCCWGDQGGVNGVVFLWVEDFYGDTWEWVDGICYINTVYHLTRDPKKYSDTAASYEISLPSGLTAAANSNKYITELAMTNDVPFMPTKSGEAGSGSTTFWCDNMWCADATQVVYFGGGWSHAASVGAFYWALSTAPSAAHARIGSRLCRF